MIREKFIDSAKLVAPDVFRKMTCVEMVYSSEMTKKAETILSELRCRLSYDITSIVSLRGSIGGFLALHLNKSILQKATSSMIRQGVREVDSWAMDAAGELCEVIAGNIKKNLYRESIRFDVGLPLVLSGSYVSASAKPPLKSSLCIFAAFYGNACLEFALNAEDESVIA